MKNKLVPAKKKALTRFRTITFSRHGSHRPLRTLLPLLPFRSCLRMGSTTVVADSIQKGGKRVEINSVQGVRNSASKLLMKQCFQKAKVKTADWYLYQGGKFFQQLDTPKEVDINKLPYPIIAKSHYGSRCQGNYKLDTAAQLTSFLERHTPSNYIFERFYNYSKEYRLHITEDGCFYTCRKMLKKDTPKDKQWFKNDSNSVWILEENPQFEKPVNWQEIVDDCTKAIVAVGLDVGSVDLRCQGATDEKGNIRKSCDWCVIETNSASGMAPIVLQKYIDMIPKLATKKAKQFNII